MFLPYFIALLMGLISPSSSNHSNCHGGTVVVNSEPNPGDPGDGGDGGGDDDTGGEGTHIPPIPPTNPPKNP